MTDRLPADVLARRTQLPKKPAPYMSRGRFATVAVLDHEWRKARS